MKYIFSTCSGLRLHTETSIMAGFFESIRQVTTKTVQSFMLGLILINRGLENNLFSNTHYNNAEKARRIIFMQ